MFTDVLKEKYGRTEIGASTWIRPKESTGIDLLSFQAVDHAADSMAQEGLIHIQEKHRESQTGSRLIDGIRFMRLK